jgi:hypothetical protein
MRIFGTVLPYIGFDTYLIEDSVEGGVIVKEFTVGWVGYYIGFIYSVEEV